MVKSSQSLKLWGARSLRFSAHFIMGVHRAWDCRWMSSLGCQEPETLGTFHHGGAESLRLSAQFIMGVHSAWDVPQMRCWEVQKAWDCRRNSAWGCAEP